MKLPRFILFGTKDTELDPNKADPRPVGVAPAGGLKVWIDGMRNTLSMAVTAVVSTLPNVTVSSMPNLVANPTKPTLLAHGLLSASDAAIYTAGAAYREVELWVANVDTSSRTYTVALNATVPGTIDDTHTLAKACPIPVGYSSCVRIPSIAAADVILSKCDSANKVSYQLWGVA
jgi:hypothetical protein